LLPGLLVKLDAFANHGVDSRSGEGRRFECPMRVVRVGIIIFGGFSVFFQLALASFCKLLPGLSPFAPSAGDAKGRQFAPCRLHSAAC
jgi:hypothetical protein